MGDPVGAAVTATDPDGDTVTYELDNDADRTTAPGDDALFFNVDQATGQITVADELDADAGDGEYEIIVRATDPSGVADAIHDHHHGRERQRGPEHNWDGRAHGHGRLRLRRIPDLYRANTPPFGKRVPS